MCQYREAGAHRLYDADCGSCGAVWAHVQAACSFCGCDTLFLTNRARLQVYKALRGGVQDVAVKVLLCTDDDQLLQFEKVHVFFRFSPFDRRKQRGMKALLHTDDEQLLQFEKVCRAV